MAGVVLCSWDGLRAGNPLGDALAVLAGMSFALVFFCARMPGANSQDYSYLGMVLCAPLSLCAFFDPSMTLEPILNPLWVFLFVGEVPGPLTVVGAIVVLAAATVYAVRDK